MTKTDENPTLCVSKAKQIKKFKISTPVNAMNEQREDICDRRIENAPGQWMLRITQRIFLQYRKRH